MNLKQILEMTAREVPHKAALVLGSRKVTYQELDESSNRIANLLIGMGLERGEHVAILSSHDPEWVSSYFGIIKAGGVAVLLSTALKAPELTSLLRDSDAKILITEKQFSRVLAPFLPTLPLLKQVLEVDTDFRSIGVADSFPTPPDVEIDDGGKATIIYTSGVLGRQK